MQLYNYQDTINKQPIYHLYKKKRDIFTKCLYSDSFIKLDSFYDQRVDVRLSESIQGFSVKKHLYSVESHVYYQLYLLEDYS